MLVLTRRLEESLMIGDPKDPKAAEKTVEVVVVEVRGDQVRIGFKAPPHVKIHRKEIWLQLQDEKKAEKAAGG